MIGLACMALAVAHSPRLSQAQVPLAGETPQLLRAPEQVLGAAECDALQRRAAYLRGRSYPDELRRTLASLERMKAQAVQGKWEADERMWTEARARSQEFVDFLRGKALEGVQEQQFRALIRSMHSRGITPAAPKLLSLKRYQDALKDLGERLDLLGDLAHDYQVTARRIGDANASLSNAAAAREQLYRDWMSDDSLREYAELVATQSPLTAAGFRLGYIAATVGTPAFERYYLAPRDIAALEDSIGKVRDALLRVDLDRSIQERRLERLCRQPGRPTREAQAPQGGGASSGTGPGFGTALAVAGAVAGGVALAAAASTAAGSQTGGGSAGGAASVPCSRRVCIASAFSCSCNDEPSNTTCPTTFPVAGSGQACITINTNNRSAWCAPGLSCTNGTCNTRC